MEEIERVCKELKLTYCLAYGTCLGAVRHKGFIPWDDDIDIFMPEDDFFKLCKHPELFEAPFFLQTNETDPEYGLMIARVRNSDTTLIEESEKHRDINHGVFVDIYPLFNCPNGGKEFKRRRVASMLYRLFLYNVAPQNRGKVMRIGSKILLKATPKAIKTSIKKSSIKRFSKHPYTGYVSSYYGNDSHVVYNYDWFFPPVETEFEDRTALIPGNADAFLKYRYGDYMQLPPEGERTMHHEYYKLDLKQPYKNYYGSYYCEI